MPSVSGRQGESPGKKGQKEPSNKTTTCGVEIYHEKSPPSLPTKGENSTKQQHEVHPPRRHLLRGAAHLGRRVPQIQRAKAERRVSSNRNGFRLGRNVGGCLFVEGIPFGVKYIFWGEIWVLHEFLEDNYCFLGCCWLIRLQTKTRKGEIQRTYETESEHWIFCVQFGPRELRWRVS